MSETYPSAAQTDTGSIAFEFSKAGSLEADHPQTVVSRARTAMSQVPQGTTFVIVADDEGAMHSHVVFPTGRRGVQYDNIAFQMGAALAAKASRSDAPDLSETPALAHVEVDLGSPFDGAANQQGVDYVNTVTQIAGAIQRGEWVALSVRRITRAEAKHHARWRQHGLNQSTHQSASAGGLVMSLWAGASDDSRAQYLAGFAPKAMPGFDISTFGRSVPTSTPLGKFIATSVGLGAVGVGLSVLPLWVPEASVVAEIAPWWAYGLGTGAIIGTVGVGQRRGWLPSKVGSRSGLLALGLVPVAGKLMRTPRPPHKEERRTQRLQDGTTVERTIPEFKGEYPLARDAVIVGPHLPLSIVAPHADAKFANRAASARSAPAALREAIGPVVVTDEEGDVHLSAADAWAGTFVAGLAGSGKTYLLEALWGWHCLELSRPVRERTPGLPDRTSMIAFDTKEDGAAADHYAQWAEKFGVGMYRFDAADPDAATGIAFFAPIGPGRSAHSYGQEVVDALIYSYGQDAIGNRSKPSLIAVFAAAALLAARPALVEPVTTVESGRSAFFYANILIGNRDDQVAVELASQIAQARTQIADRTADPDVVEVAELLEPLYGPGITPAARRNLFDAPRSKVSPLLAMDHWWSRPQQATWDQLLEAHVPVVVNFGRSPNGHKLSDGAAEQMGALAMYALYSAIKRTCAGWQSEGRRTAIFADEVKHLAAYSSNVLAWFRNDGRSFGVAPYFATQFPEQLEEQLRKTMLGYGTRIMFAQNDEGVIRQVAANLATDGSVWKPEDISTLPRYHAIVKTTLNQTAQPAFTGLVPAFAEQSAAEFIAHADAGVGVRVQTSEAGGAAQAPARPAMPSAAEAKQAAEDARRAQMREAAERAEGSEPSAFGSNTDGSNGW